MIMRRLCFAVLWLVAIWQEPARHQEAPPPPIFTSPTPRPTPLWHSEPPPAWALIERSAAWWYQPPCPKYLRTHPLTDAELQQMAAWEKVYTEREPELREYDDCVWFRAGQEIPPLVFVFYGQPDLRRVTAAGDTLLCFGSCAYMDTYYERGSGMRPVNAPREMPQRKP